MSSKTKMHSNWVEQDQSKVISKRNIDQNYNFEELSPKDRI